MEGNFFSEKSAFQSKLAYRKKQAALPFNQKIEILIRLQEIAEEIRKIAGRKPAGKVWKISSNG